MFLRLSFFDRRFLRSFTRGDTTEDVFWDRQKKTAIHFIGIGGSGMSGIAEVLLTNGFQVSGSDLKESVTTARLQKKGAEIFIGHQRDNVRDVRCVVVSSAVDPKNPEWVEALERSIPVIRRAEMLAELMRLKRGVAIAGSHGKTTTTSFLGQMLRSLQPTVVVGGLVQSWGSSTLVGKGSLFVVEADESDRSFLHFSPVYSLVTNIDREHLDTYQDLEDIEQTFLEFLNRTAFFGENWINLDCPQVRKLRPHITKPTRTFGRGGEADLRLVDFRPNRTGSQFRVIYEGRDLGDFQLSVPGEHNAINCLGAMGIALSLGVSEGSLRRSLKNLSLAARRLQIHYQDQNRVLIEDYAHHPSELKEVLKTAKLMFPESAIKVVFQPHRFSRTQALFDDFAGCFEALTEDLTLLPIYSAHEANPSGVSSHDLAAALKKPQVRVLTEGFSSRDLMELFDSAAGESCVVLVLGAGPLSGVCQETSRFLEENNAVSQAES